MTNNKGISEEEEVSHKKAQKAQIE